MKKFSDLSVHLIYFIPSLTTVDIQVHPDIHSDISASEAEYTIYILPYLHLKVECMVGLVGGGNREH